VPVLAEHGHRLLGALVGLLTLALAAWTYLADPRRWMRRLGLGALALVTLQGVLGGLRVTANSIFLAGVHACTAQVFVALLVAMAVFTTRTWRTGAAVLPATDAARGLRRLTWAAAGVLYGQIVLGALLRHAGHGVDAVFAGIHIAGAFAVTALVFAVFVVVQKRFEGAAALVRGAWAMLGVVGAQFALGLAAYVVMLYEAPLAVRSGVQITLNTAHLVTASLLLAATVATALLATRRAPARGDDAAAAPAGGDSAAAAPVLAPPADARAADAHASADPERVA
jgi:cytochrome c oxidase assembly protein subunit 15